MNRTAVVRVVAAQWMMAAIVGTGVMFAAGVTAAESPAQNTGDLTISLTAQKVIHDPDGKEVLQSAERAFPGEIVQYDALYANKGTKLISRLEPTLPIPRGMNYVPDSARPAPALASLDGKTFEPIPIKRKVTRPDGTIEEREIPSTEYRALRWFAGDIEAGGKTTVIARAKIAP